MAESEKKVQTYVIQLHASGGSWPDEVAVDADEIDVRWVSNSMGAVYLKLRGETIATFINVAAWRIV